MTTINDTGDFQRAQWLADDTKDAKRAPEIAAWLLCGPLPLAEIIAMRRSRFINSSEDAAAQAESYATASVMHDLGRVAGIAGPVEYRDGMLWLSESHRTVITDWWKDDLFREYSVGPYAENRSDG